MHCICNGFSDAGPYAGRPAADDTIQAGDKETLLDDSLRLADRARAASVEVEIDVVPEMIHIFPYFHRRLRAGDEALIRTRQEIVKHLG